MAHPGMEPTDPQTPGALERLVDDDVRRKRLPGRLGGAGFGALVLAACGGARSSSSSHTSSTRHAAAVAPPPPTTDTISTTTTTTTTVSTPAPPSKRFGTGDVGILNYVLTLEYLQSELYKLALDAALFSGLPRKLISEIAAQERTHVGALQGTVKNLGAEPAARPTAKFTVTDALPVARLAYRLKNLTVGAYLAGAADLQSRDALAVLLTIQSVEARHAAALATLVPGAKVVPTGAFGRAIDMSTVLAAITPYVA